MNDERKQIFITNEPMPRVSPSLAKEIGLNESMILLQLDWIISRCNHYIEGRYWTYQSVSDLEGMFPFWSKMTINRAINKLHEKGFIEIDNFNKYKYDRTRWFSINYDKVSELKSVVSQSTNNSSKTNKEEKEKGDKSCNDEKYQNDTAHKPSDSKKYQNDTRLYQNDTGLYQNDTTIPKVSSYSSSNIYKQQQKQTINSNITIEEKSENENSAPSAQHAPGKKTLTTELDSANQRKNASSNQLNNAAVEKEDNPKEDSQKPALAAADNNSFSFCEKTLEEYKRTFGREMSQRQNNILSSHDEKYLIGAMFKLQKREDSLPVAATYPERLLKKIIVEDFETGIEDPFTYLPDHWKMNLLHQQYEKEDQEIAAEKEKERREYAKNFKREEYNKTPDYNKSINKDSKSEKPEEPTIEYKSVNCDLGEQTQKRIFELIGRNITAAEGRELASYDDGLNVSDRVHALEYIKKLQGKEITFENIIDPFRKADKKEKAS